jgi:hypothetical protein
MKTTELQSQIEAMMKRQDKLVESLSKARTELAKAQTEMSKRQAELERVQEELTQLHRVKSLAIANRPEYLKDAAMRMEDGQPEQEWAQLVMDKFLHEDPEFLVMLGTYYEKQEETRAAGEEVLNAQVREKNLADELGSAKNQGLMMSTLMRMASP